MIKEITFPNSAGISGNEKGRYYRDSFSVNISQQNLNAIDVYYAIFAHLPKPVIIAMKIRNKIMGWLGFSAGATEVSLPKEQIATGKQAGFLVFESVSEMEVVAAAYEKNMDMWLSVLKLSEREYAVSTLVNLKTRSGRLYMAFIKPFHKLVAKFCIAQALRAKRI
ncbi:DUF2867 domain-containing protein [Photobacterium leiognathi]|uniref:DUF2867 domain-containing protein n=1 Tax=Photobacterium leiognathi TaxID=553611 RepID=UPI0029823065|nr:DUF2867 domain-containing protein [Photobacterium leiognathi]